MRSDWEKAAERWLPTPSHSLVGTLDFAWGQAEKALQGGLEADHDTAMRHFNNIKRTANEILTYKGSKYAKPENMLNLLSTRQQKYGPRNITKLGLEGILVRLSDKIERLKRFYSTEAGRDANDESIEDTLADIVGYCVLAHMNENGEMELSNEKPPTPFVTGWGSMYTDARSTPYKLKVN